MTDLTEQWKKGELPEGFYYIKCDWSDEVEIRYVHNGVDDWKAIFAEVPSFEEWQEKLRALDAAYETIKMEDETINRLVRSGKQCNYKNAQLKELLKECKEIFDECFSPSAKHGELYKKIDEALK